MADTEEPLADFMSQAHIDQMNALARQSDELRKAVAGLPREYTYVQEMHDGQTIHYWTMHFEPDDGFRFSLEKPADAPDLTHRGQLADMLAALAEVPKTGQMGDPRLEPIGDPSVLEVLLPIMDLARTKLTVPTRMPDR